MNKTKILEKKIRQMVEGITFDDVLLLPNYTDFKRSEVDLSVDLHPSIKLKIPIISSPMDTVTEEKMAENMAENGGLGIIHRNLPIEKQVAMVKRIKNKLVKNKMAAVDKKNRLLVAAAVGVGEDFFERVKALIKAEVDLLVLDSGHGFSKFIIEAAIFIKKNFPSIALMAGNIATKEGAGALIKARVDILRVGMGPGSICTTRIITGMGVPQLTAIIEAVKEAKGKAKIVADGGIKQPGDIAKALALGADCVMLGSLLAGCDEAPGKIVVLNNKKYKQYRGMGSIAAMKKGAAERYGQNKNTNKKQLIAEGVEGLVEYKDSVSDYLYQLVGSLRSSFYYLGARNINEFFAKSRFIRISRAGIVESYPHSIVVTNFGENYNNK